MYRLYTNVHVRKFKIKPNVSPLKWLNQGGQSPGQHVWVHAFPESEKSFITIVILAKSNFMW